jgi:hypothetical protein
MAHHNTAAAAAAARAKCSEDMACAGCNADAAMRAAVLCRYRHDEGKGALGWHDSRMPCAAVWQLLRCQTPRAPPLPDVKRYSRVAIRLF